MFKIEDIMSEQNIIAINHIEISLIKLGVKTRLEDGSLRLLPQIAIELEQYVNRIENTLDGIYKNNVEILKLSEEILGRRM